MSNSIVNFKNRLSKVIDTNHQNAIALSGVIESMGSDFIIITCAETPNYGIECDIDADVIKSNNLQRNDMVHLKGIVKLKPNDISRVIIQVGFIYKLSDFDIYKNNIEMYKQIKDSLKTKKCATIIDKIHSKKSPKFLENIAIIAIDDVAIDNFKIMFQERCLGKLHIYHLQLQQKKNDLISALEYFRKYHNIHMVILLTTSFLPRDIFDLSSLTNIKYIMDNFEYPYFVTISNFKENKLYPLILKLSNRNFSNIYDTITFISETQKTYQSQIDNAIAKCTDLLKQYIDNKYEIIFNLELKLQSFSHPIQTSYDNIFENPIYENNNMINNLFRQLKYLLQCRLQERIIELADIESTLSKFVINDSHIACVLQDNDTLSLLKDFKLAKPDN